MHGSNAEQDASGGKWCRGFAAVGVAGAAAAAAAAAPFAVGDAARSGDERTDKRTNVVSCTTEAGAQTHE